MVLFSRGRKRLLSLFLNSQGKHKCPCVKYTIIPICCVLPGKSVDILKNGCYTLAINLRNESIEARFARVCLMCKGRSSRQTKRVRRRSVHRLTGHGCWVVG